jgi:hypothetical protein
LFIFFKKNHAQKMARVASVKKRKRTVAEKPTARKYNPKHGYEFHKADAAHQTRNCSLLSVFPAAGVCAVCGSRGSPYPFRCDHGLAIIAHARHRQKGSLPGRGIRSTTTSPLRYGVRDRKAFAKQRVDCPSSRSPRADGMDGFTCPAARDPASSRAPIATAVGSHRDYLADKRRGLEY